MWPRHRYCASLPYCLGGGGRHRCTRARASARAAGGRWQRVARGLTWDGERPSGAAQILPRVGIHDTSHTAL